METPEAPPDTPPATRRRRRTPALIAGAAALGVVAGACVGYLVQADRAPTALPSLSQPSLAQAKGAGPEPLSAAQDRKVKTDGDLRNLLLRKPAGSRKALIEVGGDGWMDLTAYAEEFQSPANAFRRLAREDELRRVAVVDWREGSTYTAEIRLVQYRETERGTQAADDADAGNENAQPPDDHTTDGWPIPGTGDGMAYVHNKPDTSYGVSLYSAEAHAWRGDIAMEIWIYDTKPIPEAKVMDLAKRQMEQL
ncbi:hypothetical protein ABZ646_10825 [Streptomyces sp. NPDC007162]|uniref:hypothetical protein n=1 Tax=Streptomyces sp. NPDC007162 TaxID=3156917 RepID=UPI0033CF695F